VGAYFALGQKRAARLPSYRGAVRDDHVRRRAMAAISTSGSPSAIVRMTAPTPAKPKSPSPKPMRADVSPDPNPRVIWTAMPRSPLER